MKTKMIYSNYDKETRVSTTTVTNNYGTFTGYATCHPDDDVSSFFGCSLAECRANLKAFREEKKIIRYQIKALKEAYEMFSNATNFNNNSNEESHYYIDYEKIDEEKLGSSNKYQKSYIDEDGNLIIVIDSREICF